MNERSQQDSGSTETRAVSATRVTAQAENIGLRHAEASHQVFVRELASTINRLSLERFSNTPDFLLAEMLWETLITYSEVVTKRDKRWLAK